MALARDKGPELTIPHTRVDEEGNIGTFNQDSGPDDEVAQACCAVPDVWRRYDGDRLE